MQGQGIAQLKLLARLLIPGKTLDPIFRDHKI
jgi:hypothetical protein